MPDLVDRMHELLRLPQTSRLVAPRPLVPQGQALGPVEPINAFVIVFPAFPPQQHVHPSIAVMHARRSDLLDA